MILIPEGGSGAFCLKIGDVLAQQDGFSSSDHFGLIVKSATNITCLEFVQFCQVSAFSCI